MTGPGCKAAADTNQHQLPLPVHLRDDATLDNFLALPRARPLIDALRSQMQPGGEAFIYLYGASGTGKSHLLHASCHDTSVATLYLPLAQLREYPAVEVLQGVEQSQRICLDDIHTVLGDADWERALFNLYNSIRQRGHHLVVAADAAPRALSVQLPDLHSRLSSGVVFQLAEGGDEDKAAILQFRAMRRGLTLSPGVATFIVSRAPRAMEQLLGVLDQLDEASLAQQRALSIPFVKQALGW
ncbi:MAG: DnaA regulatory inactivator Hda [Halioglobus sp.]|nr:DnaA regulatory inactivator Hda [Halioglobus sp.]